MRLIVTRLFIAALLGAFLVMWSLRHDQNVVAAQQRTPVTVTRIYTGPDGQTHSETIDVKVTPWVGHDGYEQSDAVKAASLRIVRRPPGWAEDWHHGVQRQYITTLSGRGEVEVSGGQKIPLEPGQVLLSEDLTGKGHVTRALGTEDWISLHIRLADQ